jgi:acyl-CoA synthetase
MPRAVVVAMTRRLSNPCVTDLPRVDPQLAVEYRRTGWWGDDTVAQCVRRHATGRPDAPAFVEPGRRVTWAEYDRRSDALAAELVGTGVEPGDRVAVLMPDTASAHVAFLGCEKAGAVVVGIGSRAGDREVHHLVTRTGATTIVTPPELKGRAMSELVSVLDGTSVTRHVVVDDAEPFADGSIGAGRALGADDVFMLNSTSGTTGLPKVVVHTQNRWFYFHQLAIAAGRLTPDDVFMSLIPAPFGFGLWTAHFTPTILGAPCVVVDRFSSDAVLDLLERERVSVLCCVSTQFLMLLEHPSFPARDLSSLRCMFTGGEAVPYERAAAFEDATGAAVLQFYGSNETGALSGTTLADDRERRLRTAGRIIDDMEVRLYDASGRVVTGSGRPAGRGPATCLGYLDDEVANRELVNDAGWMLMGDLVEIDDDGYLTVIGRTSDFIIRGGKNISAPAVEEEIVSHPAVAVAAAVAMPDPVFGERVCAYVELVPDASLTLKALVDHLAGRGVSKEWFPERLVVLDELPRSSGGKVAKGALREDARRRRGQES